VALYFLEHIPVYLFLAVVFRDMVIVLGATAYEMVTHKLEMTPLFTSKITTFLQIMLVLCVLADMAWQTPGPMVLQVVVWLTFAFTCLSGIQYMVLWMRKAVSAENS